MRARSREDKKGTIIGKWWIGGRGKRNEDNRIIADGRRTKENNIEEMHNMKNLVAGFRKVAAVGKK